MPEGGPARPARRPQRLTGWSDARTPRAAFVPAGYATRAYDDAPIPIACHQVTTQPSLSAAIIAALGLAGAEEVLEVGTGHGYQTALLARLAGRVVSTGIWPDLAGQARRNLAAQDIGNVVFLAGDGTEGAPEFAPFDALVVCAAYPGVPSPLAAQLRAGGRQAATEGTSRCRRASSSCPGGTVSRCQSRDSWSLVAQHWPQGQLRVAWSTAGGASGQSLLGRAHPPPRRVAGIRRGIISRCQQSPPVRPSCPPAKHPAIPPRRSRNQHRPDQRSHRRSRTRTRRHRRGRRTRRHRRGRRPDHGRNRRHPGRSHRPRQNPNRSRSRGPSRRPSLSRGRCPRQSPSRSLGRG